MVNLHLALGLSQLGASRLGRSGEGDLSQLKVAEDWGGAAGQVWDPRGRPAVHACKG
jgi:hypothetical protein